MVYKISEIDIGEGFTLEVKKLRTTYSVGWRHLWRSSAKRSVSREDLIKLYQDLRDFFIPMEGITLQDGSVRVVPVPDDKLEEREAKFNDALKIVSKRYREAFKKMPKD